MSEEYRELMQQAVRELRRARERIAELERRDAARHSPAAVVGIGCRLPGGIEDPEALWRFFAGGGDAIAPAPGDRWPPTGASEATPPGAFLDDAYGFDAQFFRIAPREARLVDPQQRLLLEVAHATIEHAGIAPHTLRGSNTGVFVGISTADWLQHLTQHLPVDEIDGASGPGTNPCAAAGRVSFALGLEGPSVAINTACSSSLVALHLALQSLRAGECELALVLGVNAMLSPWTTLTFQRAGMLAADGRCKTFAAAADGYGRGEGAIGVLLAAGPAALREHLRRHAEVLGSATNQDGATAGLTVPNGPAQQRVLRAALADAGVAANDVSYVEAHGTGTLLGDPIELQALAAVYGAGRAADEPLWVGSGKTNFGHLEAAAGLLGVVKTVLQLEHGTIAPHLHFTAPNPHLPWSELPLRVPQQCTEWSPGGRRIAGVSSFSFTGTNAHVLLAAPARDTVPVTAPTPPPYVLPLAARTPAALRCLCARWARHLAAHATLPFYAVAATAARGRSPQRCRAAVVAAQTSEAAELLQAIADGRREPGTCTGTAVADAAAPAAGAPAAAVAEAFVRGGTIAWHERYPDPFPRLPLPTYTFQRSTFQVPFTAASAAPPARQVDGPTTPAPGATTLRARLAAVAPGERVAMLAGHVRAACARILRLEPGELRDDEPLLDYGFDSMRAVELATRLEHDLGLSMPFADLIDGATMQDVAAAIDARWAAAAQGQEDLLRHIAAMSDDEAARALREAGDDD
ncbi:MAG TPA: beta-ketoacyl synthase N-terminal-like domain-containing protein [Planctomycetota bacterium]|nr:beta-ketoacyl synthase N-terminal-like domain-containing protein [Planctomycetota bacterium]